jgi:hypothetical protein
MPSKMLDLQTSQQFGWNLSIFLRAFLLCLLIFHRNIRSFPYFAAYLLANLTRAVILHLAYGAWGMDSWPSYFVAWGSEAGLACLRALAVAELCRRLLGHYRGIWSLAWRVLLSCAVLIVGYSAIDAASAGLLRLFLRVRGELHDPGQICQRVPASVELPGSFHLPGVLNTMGLGLAKGHCGPAFRISVTFCQGRVSAYFAGSQRAAADA